MTEAKFLQSRLEAARQRAHETALEIEDILTRLRPLCDHSVTEPYVINHDNGYGRQTKITHTRCTYCGAIDLWNRGNFIPRSELDI